MKTRANLRWMVAGCVWVVAILLLYSTHRHIADIGECRAATEQLRSDARFRRQEAERLFQVSRLRDGLALPVNSVPLGFIGLRSDLENLASAVVVRLETLDTEQAHASENPIACRLISRGPLKALLAFLAALDQRPFLQPHTIQLKVPAGSVDALLELRFGLHYQIRAPAGTDDTPAGVPPPMAGANRP